MIERLRYWSMFLTSYLIGCALVPVVLITGHRLRRPALASIRATAQEHAGQAARREGPYLAPVTFLLTLAGVALLTWWAS